MCKDDQVHLPEYFAQDSTGREYSIRYHAIERAMQRHLGVHKSQTRRIVMNPFTIVSEEQEIYRTAIAHIQHACLHGHWLSTSEICALMGAFSDKQRSKKLLASWLLFGDTLLCIQVHNIVTVFHTATVGKPMGHRGRRHTLKDPPFIEHPVDRYHQRLARSYCHNLLGLLFPGPVPQEYVDEAVTIFDYACRKGTVATDGEIETFDLEEGVLMTPFGIYPLIDPFGRIIKFYCYPPDFNEHIHSLRYELRL